MILRRLKELFKNCWRKWNEASSGGLFACEEDKGVELRMEANMRPACHCNLKIVRTITQSECGEERGTNLEKFRLHGVVMMEK